ncbi:MAG: PfkB family carbohydrate kinase [Hyphomicrobiales bacterium]|nr:PfkB family carbohydrate kinase [Hyphomicrobiales bacterium]
MDWLDDWPGLLAFDSNYRPRLWKDAEAARCAVVRAWAASDIALPSLDDETALFGDADEAAVLDRLRGYGLSQGALKCGERGPVPLAGARGPTVSFPPSERVVETTAAGDSFNGAFLAAFLSGAPEEQAMLEGHKCATEVIGQRGAIVPTTPACR